MCFRIIVSSNDSLRTENRQYIYNADSLGHFLNNFFKILSQFSTCYPSCRMKIKIKFIRCFAGPKKPHQNSLRVLLLFLLIIHRPASFPFKSLPFWCMLLLFHPRPLPVHQMAWFQPHLKLTTRVQLRRWTNRNRSGTRVKFYWLRRQAVLRAYWPRDRASEPTRYTRCYIYSLSSFLDLA